jgi:D-glycero-alpha-D-manno-heptose 1-phosphate guanylyltransferase
MIKDSRNHLIVLAGGLGTRLSAVVNAVPKPMAPVQGKPFLEFLLNYWINQGVDLITLSVGYKHEKIKNHFGNSFNGIPLEYVVEEVPLGTGGAIKNCLATADLRFQNTLIVNGDTWFEVNLGNFIDDLHSSHYPVSMVLKKISNNNRYDGVGIDASGAINKFGIKNTKETLINGGCYCVDPNFLLNYLKAYPSRFSFEVDVLTNLANENLLYGHIQEGLFCDIGIPEDYQNVGSIIAKQN